MQTIELFCGTKSFSSVAARKGHRTFTVDIVSAFSPDILSDIREVRAAQLPQHPAVLWASPPCQAFSDMAAWWRPTTGNFLNWLTKPEILAAVSEGVSAEAARPLAGLKKGTMVTEAEKLLASTKWLPVSLRPAAVAVAEAAE